MEYIKYMSVYIVLIFLWCDSISSNNGRRLMLRFRLSISESCEELDIVLKVERQFDTQTTAHFNNNDTGPHSIMLGSNGNVTFVWTSNSSITQKCCWSVTNAKIIEVNGNQRPRNTATVLLGDMCISGTSYECTDNTTWLCSESSLSQTPATVELRSNSFTLGLPISSVSISSKCSTNNNTPSTDPSGQGPCNMTSDTFCERERRWPKTPAGTNATSLSMSCYKGTVNATRRCRTDGIWDRPYFIRSDEFHNILNMIESSPEEGLNTLLNNLTRSSFRQMSRGQSVCLLDDVYETQLQFKRRRMFPSRMFSKTFLRTANAIIRPTMDNEEDEDLRRSVGSQLLKTLDNFALNIFESSDEVTIIEEIGLIVVEYINVPSTYETRLSENGTSISLSPDVFSKDNNESVRVAFFLYENTSYLLAPEDNTTKIISPVISATTNCTSCPVTDFEQDILIEFDLHDQLSSGDNISCVFYQFEDQEDDLPTGRWNTSGCYYEISDNNIVTCRCNHLTHFAILLSPGVKYSEKDQDILGIIGQVLVPISLVCMVLIILTYTCMRSLWSMRNYIHIMLCVNLIIAQLIFIIGIDKTENTAVCSNISVILEYMFLVTFMWMLMEGVVLYVALVKVFIDNHKYYIIGFTIVSYAVPFVYMVIIVPIGFLVGVNDIPGHTHYLYYDQDNKLIACWLNYKTGFIWSFIVPVIIILIVNVGFFIMAIVKLRKPLKSNSRLTAARHWLKASISLTLVMGIAWLANLIVFLEELVAVAYIMTIFIAGQGILLFIILVPLSTNVREAYLNLWHRKQTEYEFLNKLSFSTKSSTLRSSSSLNTSNDKKKEFSPELQIGTFSAEIKEQSLVLTNV